jgi:beta-galactosidase
VPDPAQSPRIVAPLNRDWWYSGPLADDAPAPALDDLSNFERVTLPHANVRLPWHGFDEGTFQFVSEYRRGLMLPESLRGQRLFLDFDGVMTAHTVSLNGTDLGEYRGGYLPSTFELTDHLRWGQPNQIVVRVDSTERADIPPFGGRIDYLTFGGIYREASLRVVAQTFIENVFVKPVDVLTDQRRVDVRIDFNVGAEPPSPLCLHIGLFGDDGAEVGDVTAAIALTAPGPATIEQVVEVTGPVELWDLHQPRLYRAVVTLADGEGDAAEVLDRYDVRFGFREARFTPEGFFLNGRRVQLRGLNRHQTYPYVGGAMPARVQQRDALILKHEIKCNIVRTSHYPQSPHFLDTCDQIGLLVFEEIPGWQHIGDERWQDLACRDVDEMIRRDWNHPSIVLWGVRINESPDNHVFYERSNAIAHSLDDSRQTGGVRNRYESERLEDVFTFNEFRDPATDIRPPNHAQYLVTEFGGHMWPTKPWDGVERVQAHTLWHARMQASLASHDGYAGGIGWCAFDYNTHADFGSGDRVCYHGVADIFRILKPAAALYRSQCDPSEEIVLEPIFPWAMGDKAAGGPGLGLICSNLDRLKLYVGERLVAEVTPDRGELGYLPHPPFITEALQASWGQRLQDLRIEGYLGDDLKVTQTYPARATDAELHVEPDDLVLQADGSDATRVVVRVTDAEGHRRPFATGAITLELTGPAELIGENPFALAGGVGAIWIKATEQPGQITLRATHPYLGTRTITLTSTAVPPEPF